MNEFNNRSQSECIFTFLIVDSTAQQKQGRSEQFASHEKQMLIDLFDLVEIR